MLSRLFASALGILFLCASTALCDEEAGKKPKKTHAVRGVVVAVEKDKDKDSGTIVIKVHSKKTQTPAVEKRFAVTSITKFEKIVHISKGNNEKEPATFKDIAKGEHVAIVSTKGSPDIAAGVAIVVKKKG